MTALKLTVTNAGRAALANAAHDGTGPTRIAFVGVTATSFTPLPTTVAIPGEIKRISTISGGAVAADTLHVTIRDDSTDSYGVRGVGFYLADGVTIFATYSQATDLLSKSSQATLLLAGDIQFADIDAGSLTFGDTNFQLSLATTEITGVVELATDDETIAGTDTQRVITPKSLLAALNDRFGAGAPSAFVKSLLNKASALAFVTALGIRGAASYDTGAGNGLDADLLDGQHGAYYRNYANLTGVPATFTPSAHQHSAADITSGTLVVARGGTGASTFTAGSYLVGNGTNAFNVKTPAQVLTDIGAAASVHSHAISDVNGLQTALDARPLQTSVTSQITAAVNALVNGSPGALDTLKELADAMGDDPNFAATVTNALAGKVSKGGDTVAGPLIVTPSTTNPYANVSGFAYQAAGAFGGGYALTDGGKIIGLWSESGFFNIGFGVVGGAITSKVTFDTSGNAKFAGGLTLANGSSAGLAIERSPGSTGARIWKDTSATDFLYIDQLNGADIVVRTGGTERMRISNSTGVVSLAALAASGAITGASVRATGTIMAAGGFQVG